MVGIGIGGFNLRIISAVVGVVPGWYEENARGWYHGRLGLIILLGSVNGFRRTRYFPFALENHLPRLLASFPAACKATHQQIDIAEVVKSPFRRRCRFYLINISLSDSPI